MARLIDADALTKWMIKEIRARDGAFSGLLGRQAANLIGKAIDELPTVYAWHSQEETPPQKGIYLVYVKTYFIPDYIGDPDHVWMLQLAYYDEKIGWSIDKVKWWIELPEPPKEG